MADTTTKLKFVNPNLEKLSEDVLYHLGMGTSTHCLPEMFGDVKFVCIGGTNQRMETFAHFIQKELDWKLEPGTCLLDLAKSSHRFCMYKIGPVLSVSHGMGVPSLTIMLHEIIKLLAHAGAKDPLIIRIGTSGGIGLEPGTVVVSNGAVNGLIQPQHDSIILGKVVSRPADMDQSVATELFDMGKMHDFTTVTGKTLCTDDFYEGQGRLDGAICEYSNEDKMDFLKKLNEAGVKNIEMEATALAAITRHAGVRSANVCVTLVNRLHGDQIHTPKPTMLEWQQRPQKLVASYIKQQLQINHKINGGRRENA